MKSKTKIYNNRRITIFQEKSSDLDDYIPEDIEFDLSTKEKNPFVFNNKLISVELDPELYNFFGSASKINNILRSIKESIA